VEAEVSARCRTETIAVMDMVSKHPIIHLPVCTHHSMVGHSVGPFSGQAVEGFHGVEVVAESSVAGEGFVDGGKVKVVAWGHRRSLGDRSFLKGRLHLLWHLTNDRSPSPTVQFEPIFRKGGDAYAKR
jgi:hypothetical protein